MSFEIPHHELSDAEIAAVLRDIIAGAGRFPRNIELCFASVCTEYLVDGLRLAGLIVVRPTPMRLTELHAGVAIHGFADASDTDW